MKKILFIIMLLFAFGATAKEPDVMLLECDVDNGYIKNRVENMDYAMTDNDKWQVTGVKAYYMIAFGMYWEEIDSVCYAHSAYIEQGMYTRNVPYMDGTGCREGLTFGNGEMRFRDSRGGYFIGDTTNTYDNNTQSCYIKSKFRYQQGKAGRHTWSKRRKCELTKQHFYNLIKDPAYGKTQLQRQWQKERCHIISKGRFEELTGLTVKDLYDQVAKDII